MRLLLALVAMVMVGLTVTGCKAQQLGWPRTPVSAVSPDGRWRAYVRNHATIDPPEQSLWLQNVKTDRAVLVRQLAGDVDWCSAIAWAPDSAAVVFLIQDGRALAVHPANTEVYADRWLFAHTGSYPPMRAVRNLTLSAGGRAASFVSCDRRNDSQVAPSRASAAQLYDGIVSDCEEATVVLSAEVNPQGGPS